MQIVKNELAQSPHKIPDIHFYTDAYELAQDLPKYDADLIFLDECQAPKDDLQRTVSFENLKFALEKFSPNQFHYTMGRVIVVLPEEQQKTQRAFELGLANVRAVVTPFPNSGNLISSAVDQLRNFHQNHNKISLCFSGGGIEGYIYSLGVSRALDSCFANSACQNFDIFSGVSSGAILASAYAAQATSDDLVKQLFRKHPHLKNIQLSTLFDPATGELAKRAFGFFSGFFFF